MNFIYIPRANTVLHLASHSSASLSETSTNVVGCGLGSLQDDCENLLLLEMDLINVEPSEHILDTSYCMDAKLKPIMLRAPMVSWRSVIKSDVRRSTHVFILILTKFL